MAPGYSGTSLQIPLTEIILKKFWLSESFGEENNKMKKICFCFGGGGVVQCA